MSNHFYLFTKTKSRSQLVRSVYSVYLSILRAPAPGPAPTVYSPTAISCAIVPAGSALQCSRHQAPSQVHARMTTVSTVPSSRDTFHLRAALLRTSGDGEEPCKTVISN